MMASAARAPSQKRPWGFPAIIAGGAGISFLLIGLWAFFDPRSFFDSLAVFEPFNSHFIRDIGAFQAGLGAVLLLALFLRDALAVTLWGVSVGAVLHVVSHVLDRHEGGDPARDIPFFAVIAVLLLAAAVVQGRASDPGSDEA